MRAVLERLLLSGSILLVACGGGDTAPRAGPGAPPPAVPPGAEALIRFAATLSAGTVTVAPVAGATSIGTRDIASVQLKVDDGAPQVLLAPTSTNAAGQPVYAFAVPPSSTPPLPLPRCSSYRNYEITVTDAAGLSLTRYQASCGLVTFGGFSDYGDRTVTFRVASATAPFNVTFTRQGGDAGEYVDSAFFQVPAGQQAWTLRAREGDKVYFSGDFPSAAPDAARATIAVEVDGAALGTTEAAKGTAGSLMIVCCRGTVPPAPAQAVTFFVYPTALGPFPQDPKPPVNASARIVDANGQTLHSFSGTAHGATQWTFPAGPGDRLHLEAGVGEQVSTNFGIRVGTSEIAHGHASIPGTPTRFDVACCSLPRF